MSKDTSKRETLEEFLQRGGKITVVPPYEPPEEEEEIKQPSSPGGLLTLTEGSLFYTEKQKRKVRKKKMPEINVAALPASLLKYLPKQEEDNNEEADSENK